MALNMQVVTQNIKLVLCAVLLPFMICCGRHERELEPCVEEAEVINFAPQSAQYAQTRIEEAGGQLRFSGKDKMMVTAYYQTEPSALQQEFMKDQQVNFNQSANAGSGAWEYSPKKYWPGSGTLSFTAYYPAHDMFGVTATLRAAANEVDYTINGNQDIMWGQRNYDCSVRPYPEVDLGFEHKLKRFYFKANRTEAFGEVPRIERIEISGMKNHATLNYVSGSLTFSTDPAHKADFSITSNDPAGWRIGKAADYTQFLELDKALYVAADETAPFYLKVVAGGREYPFTVSSVSGFTAGKSLVLELSFDGTIMSSSVTVASGESWVTITPTPLGGEL